MHVPDGFLDIPTSLGTGLVSAGVVGVALRRSGRELREAGAPLAGLTAVFIFAMQMVNFPVGAGTSGHLMGGTLAAVLVGPWTAILCLTVVLVVQSLFFADGGLTAIGSNVLLIGVVTAVVGYLVARAVLGVLPRRSGSAVPASFVGAFASVPAAAAVFVALYSIGGAVPIPLATLTVSMLGWHLVIGIGEALITAAVVGAVLATRPDLVYLARHFRCDLVLLDADGKPIAARQDVPVAAGSDPRPVLAGLGIASLLVAGGLSLVASAHPDGLEFVGESLGFLGSAHDSAVAGSPLADYGISGVEAAWGTTLAGVAGVLLVAAIGIALLSALARRRAEVAEPRAERVGTGR